jgi:hypothetical protein
VGTSGSLTRVEVPKLYPGATIAIVGGGPSLTRDDVEHLEGRARVIVVNDGYRLAPWAEILYACDAKWWTWHRTGLKGFRGRRYGLDAAARSMGVSILEGTGREGLELRPWGVRTGHNSGYQAINVAVHLGAARIVLLGFDMQRGKEPKKDHWFGSHPGGGRPGVDGFRRYFETLPAPLKKLRIEIVNCSRRTALECFPRAELREVLP